MLYYAIAATRALSMAEAREHKGKIRYINLRQDQFDQVDAIAICRALAEEGWLVELRVDRIESDRYEYVLSDGGVRTKKVG